MSTTLLIMLTALTTVVCTVVYSTAIYKIERSKQEAFLLKVCIETGGEWITPGPEGYRCQRPK